jgi:hypothetical protein
LSKGGPEKQDSESPESGDSGTDEARSDESNTVQ